MATDPGPARRPHADEPPRAVPRLAVFISGGGRSLLNLLEHTRAGRPRAEIALVVASRECPGAQRARDAGLAVVVATGDIPRASVEELLRTHRIDLVVLAGYLRLLAVPEGYRGRVVNIHPALLPKFGGPGMYGRRVHEAVLAAGEATSGCSVHLVDDEYDHGPVLLQKSCPVLPGDTPDTLAARVFELERRALPEALELLLTRGVSGPA